MSREIKFRAFDRKRKKWVTSDDLVNPNTCAVRPTELGFRLLSPEESRYDFTQYTGLKDKNGKEIYEGDVVIKHDYNALGNTRTRTCKVEWKKDWACWGVMTENGDGYSFAEVSGEFEVIGNIYEHKHLLE